MLKRKAFYPIASIVERAILKAKQDNAFNTFEFYSPSGDVVDRGHVYTVNTFYTDTEIIIKVVIHAGLMTGTVDKAYDFNRVKVYGYLFDVDSMSFVNTKIMYFDFTLSKVYSKPANKGVDVELTFKVGNLAGGE